MLNDNYLIIGLISFVCVNNQYQLSNGNIDKGNNFLFNVIIAYHMFLFVCSKQ